MRIARTIIPKRHTWTGDPQAVAALKALLHRDAEQRRLQERIEAALQQVALCLRDYDGTDSSVQPKRFVWSLSNRHHYVNLYDLSRVLDYDNSDAVEVIFSAYMRGIFIEEDLRTLMKGKMRRWRTTHAEIPANRGHRRAGRRDERPNK